MQVPKEHSLDGVRRILRHRNSYHLAKLLSRSYVEFDESTTYGSYWHSVLTTAEIYSPISDNDRLNELTEDEQETILNAVLEIWPAGPGDMEITGIVFRLDPISLQQPADEIEEILRHLNRLRDTLISVSTGGPRINDVNVEYSESYSHLTGQLEARGLKNPIPYADLWEWYGKWSSGDLPSYQSRRNYIRSLFGPLERQLREGASSRGAEVFIEPTGWAKIDFALGEIRKRLESASTEIQYQSVGHLCRETLISLAQAVFDPKLHPPIDGGKDEISKTDAKPMLDRYLAREVSGSSNENARRHAKASLALANELTHKQTAVFRDAAICAEATASVVNIIAILSGRRNP